jgi:type I restriction enzyme S subunit
VKLPLLALDEVCLKITDGTHHSPPIAASGIPYVTAKHVKPEGLIFFEDPWYVSEADHSAIYSRCDPKKGDVLYIKDGATTGIAALNTYDFPFSMLSSVALLRPKPELCDSRFLCWWLNSPISKEKFIGQMGGAAIKRLTLAKIKRFEIPLPPLAEQRRIAEVLDKAEALRAKRRAALAQLDSLTQSLFLDLFGDPITNQKGFPISRMGDVCDVRDGTHDSPKYVSEEGYPLVTSKNLTTGVVDLSDVNYISENDYEQINRRSKVNRGDIIMPMIGTIGSPVLVEDEPCFAIKNVALIKFTEASPLPIFVRHLLSSHYFDHLISQKNRGGTQKFVSLGDLRGFLIPLPPLDLQREFARRVTAVEKLKTAQRTALAELDSLFASLQHRAFRGEL